MEMTLRARELRERMSARRVTIRRLAQEAGLIESDVSAMLRGRDYIGPKRGAKLGLAIVRLGLDKELDPDEKAEQPDEPVIRIRPL